MKLRAVLDTNVVFEGLTQSQSACGLIVDAWNAEYIEVCVSNTLLLEYIDVLSRKLSSQRWQSGQIVLRTLMKKAAYIPIYYSWRPSSPDPGDEFVIDCAMNGNAILVTSNIKDFRLAQSNLGLTILTPLQFLMVLDHPQ